MNFMQLHKLVLGLKNAAFGLWPLASSRRSVSWGEVRKTLREKLKKRGEFFRFLSWRFFFFIFSARCFSGCGPN